MIAKLVGACPTGSMLAELAVKMVEPKHMFQSLIGSGLPIGLAVILVGIARHR